MHGTQDQSQNIAAVICKYCRRKSPLTPYKCVIRTDQMLNKACEIDKMSLSLRIQINSKTRMVS